jgi:hypothetical protein
MFSNSPIIYITLLFLFACAIQPVRASETDVAGLKTFGIAGKEKDVLTHGTEAVLFLYKGRGCLTHMWFGGSWPGFEHTRIRIYVDGEKKPSIDMELGMGHGVGFGDQNAPWGIARIGKTGDPSGIYNTYRIPFGRSIRVTGQLGDGVKTDAPFWWIVRGTENLPVVVGGVQLPANARLKLYKLENFDAKPLEEFALCNVTGAGELYQVTIAAKGDLPAGSGENFNYLEACMRAYMNGSKEPLLLSSGLEDYFLGTYYFNRGLYANPVAGLTHLDHSDSSFSAYRFHDDDPVFFQHGLRLTCRCGEKIGDKVFGNPQETTYTTYAWLYEW